MSTGKFILNFCPTGMIPTKAMTPHVPITPSEIVREVVRLHTLYVPITMVHIHARDKNGNPTWKRDVYARIIGGIREHNEEIVICVSTSGRDWSEFAKRSDVLTLTGDYKPDMASLTLSSLNFNKVASVNSPQMIQDLAKMMMDKGIRPELEVFDTGMMNYVIYLASRGYIGPPFYFNFILGNSACAQADPLSLGVLLAKIQRPCMWSVGGVGNHQMRANVLGLASGGGVRVGLEDNIWWTPEREELATNSGLLGRIAMIASIMGLIPMSGSELRGRLKI